MGRRGREVGEKGEGSGGKGGGNWEWGTPLSTPSVGVVSPCHHLCSLEGVASVPHIFCKTNDRNIVQASR